MRRIVSVLLFLLGAAAIVIGVGKVSFMSPAPTLTASVPAGQQDAPVTLLTPELREATAGDAKVTVHAEGSFSAVVGRSSDVDAWVSDAAANVVNGVDRTTHEFSVTHRNGVATTPDPAGSDLWITEEQHSGDWEAAWTVPNQGDWTLMLATDGKTPAPVDISMTWDNPAAETGAKWRAALPWLVGGVLGLALGALVLFSAPRRRRPRKADVATSPRRAARLAAETGQLPVVTPAVPSAEDPAAAAPSVQAARAAAVGTAASVEETMIHPRLIAQDAQQAPLPAEDAWLADAAQPAAGLEDEAIVGPGQQTQALPVAAEDFGASPQSPDESDENPEENDDDDEPGTPGSGSGGAFLNAADEEAAPKENDGGKPGTLSRRALRMGAAVLASVGLVLPAAPAIADETTSPTASTSPSISAEETAEQALPVILQAQLDRILKQSADEAAVADKSRKVEDLATRFGGAALEVRKDYYAALAKGVKYPSEPVAPIEATSIKAAAVTTSTQWPRTIMVVTQATSADTPVVMTLEQEDARSNYKVIQAVSMVPGVAFPGVALGSTGVVTQDAETSGLVAKPSAVVEAFGEWVSNSKSSWNDKFETSAFVTALREQLAAAKKANESNDQRAKNQMSFAPDASSTRVLAAPQGGSLVSGYVTATNTIAPDNDGTITLTEQVQKLTGEKTTKKNVVITYRIPVTFYVPAAGSGEKIRLVAAEFVLANDQLK